MRIAFMDFVPWEYDVATVQARPMGGSQSAASYLAVKLARLGHQIYYMSNAAQSGMVEGVAGISWRQTRPDMLRAMDLDAAVALMTGAQIIQLRDTLGPRTKLIMWSGHPDHEPSVQYLMDRRVHDLHDAFVFVSQWQAMRYRGVFGISPGKIEILGNAVAPAFERLFNEADSIAAAKEQPPVLAFTSIPYRGLDFMLDTFPEIRRAVPGTRLRVYSSMGLYMMNSAQEPPECVALYDRARKMDGVEYIGMLPQAALAKAMRGVTMLTYPTPVAETSCIAVMEAMAAGCHVVTTHAGGVPETAAGFASLVQPEPDTYKNDFMGYVVDNLNRRKSPESEARLRGQVAFVNREYTWEARAREWERFLKRLAGR